MATVPQLEVSVPQVNLGSGSAFAAKEEGSPTSPRMTASKAELVLRDLVDKELIYFKCLQAVKYVRYPPFFVLTSSTVLDFNFE